MIQTERKTSSGYYHLQQGILVFWKCSLDGVFYPLKPPCQVLNPKFGSEIGLMIYLKLLHGWRECHTVLRSLEWRDVYAVSPLSLWEVISYNSRAGLQEWERLSAWSLAVSLPTRWVTGNAWVLIFSPVAAIALKPLAGKRLKQGDKHVNLPRPSPSAAASLPLCISRCSLSWTTGQNDVPWVPRWDVTQTLSRLSAGAGRSAFRARGFARAGRAVCFVSKQSKLGRLSLFTQAPLPSGLCRKHPLFPRVLSTKDTLVHSAFPSVPWGRVLKQTNRILLYKLAVTIKQVCPFGWVFQVPCWILEWGQLSLIYCFILITVFAFFSGFLFYLLSWHGKMEDMGVIVSASLPSSGLVVMQTE